MHLVFKLCPVMLARVRLCMCLGASGMTMYYAFKAVMGIFKGRKDNLFKVVFQRYSAEMGMYVGA